MLYLPAEFPIESGICYLNHAAVAPWPKRTADAVQKFAFTNMTRGATDYLQWVEVEAALREKLANLVNAPSSDDIALVKNTSEGLSLVANGLDWQSGDEIVGISDDFPSNRIVWEALASQGVKFIPVDITSADDPEQALMDACGPNTRLMAISSVHFATGLRLQLKKLSDYCRSKNILISLDAIQSIGAVPFDLAETPVDFISADGHKWMLAPEGLGFFYCRAGLRETLKLTQFGWAMREKPHAFAPGEWFPTSTGRRFECGSPNMLGIHALNASLGLLLEVGMPTVFERLQDNIARLRDKLEQIPDLQVVTPEDPARHAGILAFHLPDVDSDLLYRHLMENQLICAARGGCVRLSPHFYTAENTLNSAHSIIQRVIQNINNNK